MKKKSILGLQEISNRELGILAPIIQADTNDKEKTLLTVKCIDDMLNLIHMESLLNFGMFTKSGAFRKNQKRHLHEFINDRLDVYLEQLDELNKN